MTTIAEIREKFPQYSSISDADLLRGVHNRFYSDMPLRDFIGRIDGGQRIMMLDSSDRAGGMEGALARAEPLNAAATNDVERGGVPEGMVFNPTTGQYTSRELLANHTRMNDQTSKLQSGTAGFAQGATFGTSDEALGAINALVPGAGTMGERYEFGREAARAQLDAARAENPYLAYGGEITGALAAPGAALGAARNARMATKMVVGSGVGAGQGAAYGFGSGEGDLTGRLSNAGWGAGVGAVAGGLAPPIFKGLGQGVRAAWNAASSPFRSSANTGTASQAIASALAKSGQSQDDVAAALRSAADDGQSEFTIADALGKAGQRMLGSMTRTGNSAQDFVSRVLSARQDSQARRVGGFVSDALGNPDTAKATETALTAARDQAANAAYGAARNNASPVNLNNTISTIDDLIGRNPILGDTALSNSEIGRRLASIRDRMTKDGEQLIDFDAVLNLKQDLYQQMQSNPRVASQMRGVYDALDSALEAASPAYRSANDDFARASRVIETVDEGRRAASPRVRSSDTVENVSQMTGDQANAFRAGYADPILAKIENGAIGVNKVRPLRGDGTTETLEAIANDPALLARRLMREDTMFETARKALGGSDTAERVADDLSGSAMQAINNAASGNLGAALRNVGSGLFQSLSGKNTATRDEIARLLLSQDLDRALAPSASLESRRQLVEALLSGGTRKVAAVNATR